MFFEGQGATAEKEKRSGDISRQKETRANNVSDDGSPHSSVDHYAARPDMALSALISLWIDVTKVRRI